MSDRTHACPECGKDDQVRAVPAVYLAGADAVTSRERDRDGDVRTVTRTVTTALTDALSPVPRAPRNAFGCFGVLAAMVAVGTFLGGAIAGKWFEDGPAEEPSGWGGGFGPPAEPARDLAFLGWISGAALLVAILVFALVLWRRTAFARLMRGRQRAEELWTHGWYCHRCGTVHLVGVPGEDHAPLTLQRFRERVWGEGGYGHLAAVQRALGPVRA